MKQFDTKLQQLQQQVNRKKQLEAQQQSLYEEQKKLQTKISLLRLQNSEEQKDVDKLERTSFASIWAKLSGNYDEKLNQEKKEAFAAAARYETAVREQDYVSSEIRRIFDELKNLDGIEAEYNKLLKDTADAIAASGDEWGQEVLRVQKRIAYIDHQKREVNEACSAGSAALSTARSIAESLDSAHGWAVWDLLGGGLLTDMMKHDRMNEAQRQIDRLMRNLSRFRTELADVHYNASMSFQMDGFTVFGDYFFDGVLFDWMAMDHINQSRAQIKLLAEQLETALEKLRKMDDAADQEKEMLQNELNQLVLSK